MYIEYAYILKSHVLHVIPVYRRLPRWLSGKESACQWREMLETEVSDSWVGKISPGGGNDNLFQYSCLENPMGRGAWQATVHGVTKSQTRLSD